MPKNTPRQDPRIDAYIGKAQPFARVRSAVMSAS